MDNKQALEVLTEYNNWRRDRNDINKIPMPHPKDVGEAIDIAIDMLKAQNASV